MVNMNDKSEPVLFDKIKGVLIKIQEVSARIRDLEVERERLMADLTTLLENSLLTQRELQQEIVQQELKEENTFGTPNSVVTEPNNVLGAMKSCCPQNKTPETESSPCESTNSCRDFVPLPIAPGSTVVSSSKLEHKETTTRCDNFRDVDDDSLRKGDSAVWVGRTNFESVVPTKKDLCISSQESSEDASYICYVESPYNGEFDREPTEDITLDSVFQLELASRDAKQAIVSFVGNSVTMEGFLRNPQKMSQYGMETVGDYKRPTQIETETPGEAELRADGKWHLVKPVKVKLV